MNSRENTLQTDNLLCLHTKVHSKLQIFAHLGKCLLFPLYPSVLLAQDLSGNHLPNFYIISCPESPNQTLEGEI